MATVNEMAIEHLSRQAANTDHKQALLDMADEIEDYKQAFSKIEQLILQHRHTPDALFRIINDVLGKHSNKATEND